LLKFGKKRKIPKIWLESKIVCLYKRGKISSASNYRAISISSTFGRILSLLIVSRLDFQYNRLIDSSQCGFLANKSCTDAFWLLENSSRKFGQESFLLFLDLKSAYDRIPRNLMFRIMRLYFDNTILIDILELLYKNNIGQVKNDRHQFKIQCGCRQGSIESPLMFNVYMDWCMRLISCDLKSQLGEDLGIDLEYNIPNECSSRSERNQQSGTLNIHKILYADDAVIIFKTAASMKKGFGLIDKIFSKYGLSLSYKKCEFMISNPASSNQINFIYKKNLINHVNKFKYLGNLISSEDTYNELVSYRIKSARAKFSQMKLMLRDNEIALSIRTKFLISFVRSRLTYGCGAWSINLPKSILNKLDTAWIDLIRKMVRGGYQRKSKPPSQGQGQTKKKRLSVVFFKRILGLRL